MNWRSFNPSVPFSPYVKDADVFAIVAIACAILLLRIGKSAAKDDTPVARIMAETRAYFLGIGKGKATPETGNSKK